jgi:hypothetical protein
MTYPISSLAAGTEAPPIAEAMSWIRPGARNRELLNLAQAVPSHPPAPELLAALKDAIDEPETSLYTDILGLPSLRQAFAEHLSADYAADVQNRDIGIVAGCNQAFCATLMAIAEAGDNVILPAPHYFNHAMWLGLLDIEARTVDSFAKGSSFPALHDIEAAIDSRTRAIVICSPNNPTGAIYPADLIEEIHGLAKSRNIALITDETYKDFRDDPAPPHRLFSDSQWRGSFIQLYSFSKVYALTGYRVGAIAAAPRLLAEVEKIIDCMAICAPHIGQRAALFGLRNLQEWAIGKRDLMAERKDALRRAFRSPGLKYELVSSGAYFAYVKHPFDAHPSKGVARRLTSEHDVLCLPGSMFGPGQERYLRFAYANAEATAMDTLAERLIESQISVNS